MSSPSETLVIPVRRDPGDPRLRLLSTRVLMILATLPVCGAAFASNGYEPISYGAESDGLGGADVAVVRDTSALATNPAGLSRIGDRQLDLYLTPFHHLSTKHADSLGNNELNEPRSNLLIGGGYALRLGPQWVAGIGLFVQGGVGFNYHGLDTGYGTRDDISANFGLFKLVPGISWQINDKFSLGATLGLGYAQARQKDFPETSVVDLQNPNNSLFGSRLDGLSTYTFSGSLGFKYEIAPKVFFGLVYHSKTQVPFDGGKLTVNYEGLGAGRVQYRDTRLRGFAFPQDLRIGLAFSPLPSLLVSLEASWLDWSGAFKNFELVAGNPDRKPDSLPIPQSIDGSTPLNYRDQYVFAAGMAYELNDRTVLRAGFNHGRQPSPGSSLSPVLSPVPQNHYTLGLGYELTRKWELATSVQYDERTSIAYSNPSMRITEHAVETHESLFMTFMVTRRW